MAANRVKSKNLFNFRPAGIIDADIVEQEKAMMEKMGFDLDEMLGKMQAMSEEEFLNSLRGMMAGIGEVFNGPLTSEAENSCDHSTVSVPTTHGGDYAVPVLVHTPKALARESARACIVYAHGGGAVAGTADMYKGFLSYMAMDCGVVVFNVDYRLAPETRCPNNVLDFYEVVKYVSLHAADLGVDPNRIAMAGESGGGYICAGAMVHLARQGEGHLVKLAVPVIPMLSDDCFGDKAAMTKHEADNSLGQQKIWRLIAGPGIESMSKDALLYPGKADDETLSKMPPTIVWENEFDLYITEATRFASRLRAAGRLLEFVVIPGTKHGSGMMESHACFKVEREAWRMAMQEYLLK
eukprot:GFUD01041361.1.p1 GENE.GFUD01041361.1~~GFUD01041361.1.p1  ORF type:complete len:353 (+),score=93.20 GFUD01041361.1:247-1305(+)